MRPTKAFYGTGTALALILATSAAMSQTEVRIAIPETQNDRIAAEAFKAHVESATDDELQVQIIIHGAVGGARSATDQLRLGELQLNFADAGGYSGVLPDMQVYSWPFLFSSRSVFYELMMDAEYVDDIHALVREKTGDSLQFLGAAENSIRHIYTTRGPIRTPDDLKAHSIKMRTRELQLDQQLFAALGSPQIVALPAPERYTALQTGLIDGTEGGLESALTAGLLEVSDYVTLTGHAYDYFFLFANGEFYNGLSEDQKAAVDEASRLMVWVANGHKIVGEAEVLNKIRADGINVHVPTPSELAQWQEIARPVGESVVSQVVGADFRDATLEAIDRVSNELNMRYPSE